MILIFFFFKQKTAYEMRISDWSSDVCSSDLAGVVGDRAIGHRHVQILADQHALATHVADIVQRLEALGHRCSPFVSFPRKREPISCGRPYRNVRRWGPAFAGVTASNRKSTRLNSSHSCAFRMPSAA